MQREIPTVVVTPDEAAVRRLPVVYLLHGYSGDELAWQRITDLRPLAEQFGVIFVCPDGENSWYWDSPINPSSQFETFVSQELPDWVDAHYPTLPSREGRAVAGLSMGGHGALWTAVRHKDRFGAVGSVSGGVDIRPFPDSWEMKAQLGEERENQARWDAHTVINAVDSLRDGELAIFVDCGYDDFFYGVNVALHESCSGRVSVTTSSRVPGPTRANIGAPRCPINCSSSEAISIGPGSDGAPRGRDVPAAGRFGRIRPCRTVCGRGESFFRSGRVRAAYGGCGHPVPQRQQISSGSRSPTGSPARPSRHLTAACVPSQ